MARQIAVPAAADLDPIEHTWPAGELLIRIYSARHDPLAFNPTEVPQRFRPIRDGKRIVPTAYAGEDEETALAEGLLRGVDAIEADRRPRLYRKEVDDLGLAGLVPKRPLRLAQLNGPGLTRIGAQAIYDCPTPFDGLLWTSRQNDNAAALILWEGRIDPDEDLRLDGEPLALDSEPGLDLVREACLRAGVDFAG